MEFKLVPLYGGALAVELPSTFADVSGLREVPDNQEIYLDAQGFTNVIVELLERVDKDKAATDEDALKYHLHDIVSTETDETKIWGSEAAQLPKLSGPPAYTLFSTQHVDRNAPGRQAKEDFTATFLTLVRLEKQKTDILVAINVPHIPGEYKKEDIDISSQKLGKLIEDGQKIRQRILETFEIKDYGVFGTDEKEN